MDLAIHCCSENPDDRPTMESVVESLEFLSKLLEANVKTAKEVLGEKDGAMFWVAASSMNVKEKEESFADPSYVVTLITDRLWDKSNRNLSDQEASFLKGILPAQRVSLNEFAKFWSFYKACERIICSKSILPLWKDYFVDGFISKEETLSFLEKAKPGTFVIRFTTSAAGKLVVSYHTEGKVSHLMVAVSSEEGGFVIGQTKYASFLEILEKSKVFTHVGDKPISEFATALKEAAGKKEKKDILCFWFALIIIR